MVTLAMHNRFRMINLFPIWDINKHNKEGTNSQVHLSLGCRIILTMTGMAEESDPEKKWRREWILCCFAIIKISLKCLQYFRFLSLFFIYSSHHNINTEDFVQSQPLRNLINWERNRISRYPVALSFHRIWAWKYLLIFTTFIFL